MLSTSLNQVGSTGDKPFTFPGAKPSNFTVGYGGLTQTPQAKALSSAQNNKVTGSLKPGGMSTAPNYSTPTPAPSTPVKSTKITNVDGSTHEATYHAPEIGSNPGMIKNGSTTTTTPPAYDAKTGLVTDYGKSLNSGTTNTSTQTNNSTTGTPTTYGGLIGAGATASQNATNTGAGNIDTANKGLINIAQNGNPDVQRYTKDISDIEKQNANTLADINSDPNLLQGATDARSAIAANLNTGRLNAAQAGLTNALSGQGQQITAGGSVLNGGLSGQSTGISGLNSAASGIRPENNFPFVFNPGSGTFSTPGTTGSSSSSSSSGAPQLTFNPQQDAQTLAQEVMDKKISYNDAVTALGYGGKNGIAEGQLSQAVIGKGGDPTILKSQNQSKSDFTAQYTAGQAKLDAADNIAKQIASTFGSDSSLNKADLSLWTNFNQILSGATGTANQQKLTQQINSYINTLGLDPSTVIPIAYQQKKTVGELLTSLYDTYKSQNDVYKNGGSYAGGSSSSSSSSGANPWH